MIGAVALWLLGAPSSRDTVIYFHVHANGYIDTYYYPALPLRGNLHVDPILLFPTGAMVQLAEALKLMGLTVMPDPNKATVIVSVDLDSGVTPNVSATETDSITGGALIINAAPVSIMVDATVSGMALRGHPISGFMNSVTQTEIQP